VHCRCLSSQVWAHPAKVMDWQWMGERVAQVRDAALKYCST
jgi:hypothetical protein